MAAIPSVTVLAGPTAASGEGPVARAQVESIQHRLLRVLFSARFSSVKNPSAVSVCNTKLRVLTGASCGQHQRQMSGQSWHGGDWPCMLGREQGPGGGWERRTCSWESANEASWGCQPL